jgi:hypothetical protein
MASSDTAASETATGGGVLADRDRSTATIMRPAAAKAGTQSHRPRAPSRGGVMSRRSISAATRAARVATSMGGSVRAGMWDRRAADSARCTRSRSSRHGGQPSRCR